MSQLALFNALAPGQGAAPVRFTPDHGRYFFSGCGQARDFRALGAADVAGWRCGGMVSAHRVLDSPGLLKHVAAAAERGIPLTLDSGAFSKSKRRVQLGEYARLLRDHGHRFQMCVNLDVMGDVAASDEHWRQLREAGHSVAYVHQAQDVRSLAETTEAARAAGDDLVCLGGLVPFLKRLRLDGRRRIKADAAARARRLHGRGGKPDGGSANVAEPPTGEEECVRWLVDMGRQAHALGLKLHLLGVSSLYVLRCLATEPWYASADATTWNQVAMYGKALDTYPWRYGQQVESAAEVPEGASFTEAWQLRAVHAMRTVAGCVQASIIPIWHPTHGEDGPEAHWCECDEQYFLRVELARRLGCEDETECLEYLQDVLSPAELGEAWSGWMAPLQPAGA
jgi:hypothetical protein